MNTCVRVCAFIHVFIQVHICVSICTHTQRDTDTHTEREIYFKELTDTIMEAGKSKVHSAGLQDGNSEAGVHVVDLGQNFFFLRKPSAVLLWLLK